MFNYNNRTQNTMGTAYNEWLCFYLYLTFFAHGNIMGSLHKHHKDVKTANKSHKIARREKLQQMLKLT